MIVRAGNDAGSVIPQSFLPKGCDAGSRLRRSQYGKSKA